MTTDTWLDIIDDTAAFRSTFRIALRAGVIGVYDEVMGVGVGHVCGGVSGYLSS